MCAGFGLQTSLPHSSCSSVVKLLFAQDNGGTSVVTMSEKDVKREIFITVLKTCILLTNIFGKRNGMSLPACRNA